MAKNAYVNVRVEEEVKRKAEEILNELGINTSTAIDIYLNQIILKDGLPFDVKLPKMDISEYEELLAKDVDLVKPYPRWFRKIAYLYSNGDISIDTAIYARDKYLNN